MKYSCKIWKCWLSVFYPFEANLRAAETTVSKRMCAGFNLQLSTLSPMSPGVHSARWSIEVFMRWSSARPFFLRHFAFFPDAIHFAHTLASWCSNRPQKSASNDGEKLSWILRTTRFRYVDALPSAGMGRWKHQCAPFLRIWGGGKAPFWLKTSLLQRVQAPCISLTQLGRLRIQRATAFVLARAWNTFEAGRLRSALQSTRPRLAPSACAVVCVQQRWSWLSWAWHFL